MRILALRGRNIASLEAFEVDFQAEPLRSAGVFAITGPTGSGKSSLLDAMCLALYQKAPRLDDLTGREDAKLESRFGAISQSDIRNLLRRGCETGFAECDFRAGDGSAYRARWGYRAPRKSGARVQEEMSLVRLDDGQVLVDSSGRKGEFQESVQRLVGLSYAQFTRTVLLAQGRFAEFLRSNASERADLLERLTGTGLYSRVSRRVHERTAQLAKERAELERDLERLPVMDPAAREAREAGLARESAALPGLEGRHGTLKSLLEGTRRLEQERQGGLELERRLAELEPALAAGQEALAQAQARLEALDREREAMAPELAKARTLDHGIDSALQRLEEQRKACAQARARREELEQEHAALDEAIGTKREELLRTREWAEAKRGKLHPLFEAWPRWQELLRQAGRLREQLSRMSARLRESARKVQDGEEALERDRGRLAGLAAPVDLDAASVQQALHSLHTRLVALSGLEPRLELESRIARQEAELERARHRHDRLLQELPAAEATWKTARSLLDSTAQLLSNDVSHLRSRLVPGQCCPVCGGTEHPWALRSPVEEGILEAHREHEARARQELELKQGQIRDTETFVTLTATALDSDRERLATLETDALLLAEARGAPDPLAWLQEARLEADREAGHWQELRDLVTRRDALRTGLELARSRQQGLLEGLERDRGEETKAAQELEALLAQLDAPFGSVQWRGHWEGKPDFLPQLEGSLAKYGQSLDAIEALERDLLPLDARLEAGASGLETRRLELEALEETVHGLERSLASLRQERTALLAGLSVSQAEDQALARHEEARQRLDSARHGLQRLREGQSALLGQADGLRERLGAEQARLLRMHAQLQGSGSPPLDTPSLEALLATCEQALAACREQVASLRLELAQDRSLREQQAQLRQGIAACGARLAHWSLLDAEIGSADGKAFKLIAQQFTLESLLEETNRQLRTIAPRYTLQRLEASMHFGVVDHESFGELRPAQTLSGGETFLVSLALALGLSRMAGGEVAVESLFIDEGFGTLDPETLQGVMAALSGLHAQGRKVGLITHVEDMKEQIPVQVKIVRMGQGRSRLQVEG